MMPVRAVSEQEVYEMPEHFRTTDVVWGSDENCFKISNVPFLELEDAEKEYYSSEVTLKLLLLKELMENGKVPKIIDFNKVKDI